TCALPIFPSLSWEMATLIEIVACTAVFLSSGYIGNNSVTYQQRVDTLFRKLETPLTEEQKPKEDWNFQRSMNRLYAFALALTGLLFLVMSIPSIQETSGKFSSAAGIGCLVLAGVLWYYNRNHKQKESNKYESIER